MLGRFEKSKENFITKKIQITSWLSDLKRKTVYKYNITFIITIINF